LALLVLSLGGLACAVVAYACLSGGVVEFVLTSLCRNGMLDRVKVASEQTPTDMGALTDSLGGPDWYVAAVAAERIRELWLAGKLEPAQAESAVSSLLEAVASRGHWWRFGWDLEESDYERFRGAVIKAIAAFGSTAMPTLLQATVSRKPLAREVACWAALEMTGADPTSKTLIERQVLPRAEHLAQHDPDPGVRIACSSLQRSMSSPRE
jgi:hypothetical protein